MSPDDEFIGREGSRLGAGVEVSVLVRLVTCAGRNSTTGQTWDLIWYYPLTESSSSLSRLNGHDFLSETLALPSRRTLLTTT